MILGFKQQFVQPILDGTKIHSLRQDPHNRWHAGREMQLATGVRTKNYNCFKEDICISVQEIYMIYSNYLLEILINDKYLEYSGKVLLAKNDGFNSFEDFESWFAPEVGYYSNEPYSMKIIHWTDFKY